MKVAHYSGEQSEEESPQDLNLTPKLAKTVEPAVEEEESN